MQIESPTTQTKELTLASEVQARVDFTAARSFERNLSTQASTEESERSSVPPLESRPIVLVIDDESSNIDLLVDVLGDDYEVLWATQGMSGLEIAAAEMPQVILLDVMMPGMDGYGVLYHLKAEDRTRDIPVIFVTGIGDAAAEAVCLELGAADYISKPINPAPVRARVKTQIKLKRAQEELAELAARELIEKYMAGVAEDEAREQALHFKQLAMVNESMKREIAERKKAEADMARAREKAELTGRRLEAERKRLRALIDNIPDFMYVKDSESRFVVANREVARNAGFEDPEKLLGTTDFDIFPRELAQTFYEDEQYLIRSGQPLFNHEETCVDKAGNQITILTTKVPLWDHEGRIVGLAGVGRNISDQKKNENALREAERKYRGIFDEAVVGIFQATQDGRFESVNPAMASIFAFDSPDAMLLRDDGAIRPFLVKPECWDEFTRNLESSGRVQNFECEALRDDCRKIWISLSARLVCDDARTIRIEGMSEDVTERKTLREQLMQSQKLESIGQLIAGISHEINTPVLFVGTNVLFLKDAFRDLTGLVRMYDKLLVAVRGNVVTSELISEISSAVEHADADYLYIEIPKAIDETLDGITRVGTLMDAMKEYSHPGTKEKTPLDLNHAIQSMITVARNEWKNIADIEAEFDPSLPLVSVLPGEFEQVILNLVVNAAHAIGEKIARNPSDRRFDKGVIRVRTINRPGFVEIRIQDTGCGISEKAQTRVFDPFFTTKEMGKGTGQGLTMARSIIVDGHAGSIDFTTEDGKGTTFIIHLPN